MPILSLHNLHLRRDGKVILDDISWTIEKGQHWALIGRNGSGKTMLLKIVTGYLWPTTGQVEVLGHKFGEYDLRELRKEIGWVSLDLQFRMQEGFLAQDVVLSGLYASIGLFDKPTEEDRQKATELMQFMECEDLLNRSFNTLSYGEQKRLIIARALMTDPKLLILDEPCTGLDLLSREHFLQGIQKLGEKPNGPTIIFVTHHIEELMPFITHTLCIKDGKTLNQGTIEAILTDQLLSECLEIPLQLQQIGARHWVRVGEGK
ncbi:MAG: ABC transporter ATP-binding protein [bacterium]